MALGPADVLPVDGITVDAGVEIYQRYVSLATQRRDGVIMWRLNLLSRGKDGGEPRP